MVYMKSVWTAASLAVLSPPASVREAQALGPSQRAGRDRALERTMTVSGAHPRLC